MKFNSDVSKNQITYKLKGNGISGLEYDVEGKLLTGLDGGSNRHAENVIDLKLPSDYIKHINIKSDYTMSSQEGSPCQIGFKQLMNLYEKVKNEKGLKFASTLSKLAPGLMPSCEVNIF